MKGLLIIVLPPIVLAIIYVQLLKKKKLRRHVTDAVERSLKLLGILIVVGIVLLATGMPGSGILQATLTRILQWLHT